MCLGGSSVETDDRCSVGAAPLHSLTPHAVCDHITRGRSASTGRHGSEHGQEGDCRSGIPRNDAFHAPRPRLGGESDLPAAPCGPRLSFKREGSPYELERLRLGTFGKVSLLEAVCLHQQFPLGLAPKRCKKLMCFLVNSGLGRYPLRAHHGWARSGKI